MLWLPSSTGIHIAKILINRLQWSKISVQKMMMCCCLASGKHWSNIIISKYVPAMATSSTLFKYVFPFHDGTMWFDCYFLQTKQPCIGLTVWFAYDMLRCCCFISLGRTDPRSKVFQNQIVFHFSTEILRLNYPLCSLLKRRVKNLTQIWLLFLAGRMSM